MSPLANHVDDVAAEPPGCPDDGDSLALFHVVLLSLPS
jgi:hypothetical protein